MSLKKVYYYLYYRLALIERSTSRSSDGKGAVGAIAILELLLIIQSFVWLEIFKVLSVKILDILWSNFVLIGIVILLILVNYYIFLNRLKWIKYSNTFDKYNKQLKRRYDFLVIAIIIFVFSTFVFSFYILYNVK